MADKPLTVADVRAMLRAGKTVGTPSGMPPTPPIPPDAEGNVTIETVETVDADTKPRKQTREG